MSSRTALSLQGMKGLAVAISKQLHAGDILLFDGPLGAGKSHLSREILYAYGLDETTPVPSPTFTLMNEYVVKDQLFLHLDLYRLSDPEELTELGVADQIGQAIILIEWGEMFYEAFKRIDWRFSLRFAEPEGRYVVASGDPQRIEALAALCDGVFSTSPN